MPNQQPGSCKPQRSAASTALWAHLLRKDIPVISQTSSNTLTNPPIAPLDKAGTSMRILLHDTQANLEKFSEHVDKLASGVSETKREMMTMQKLFQEDHEQLVGQIVDLANRCQTEIQKSVGAPAQAHKLDDLHNETHLTRVRMEALDKRVDSLQMINHAQSQALQLLQDQQNKIIAGVLPLLPLLQAVPLHIEAAKNAINERIWETQIQPSVLNRSSNEVVLPRHSSNTAGAGPLLSPTGLSQTTHSRKRKRSSAGPDRDRDMDDIGMDDSNRIPVRIDERPSASSFSSSTSASRTTSQAQTSVRPAKYYARTLLSNPSVRLQPHPNRTSPTSVNRFRSRPSSSHDQNQNQAPPKTFHQPPVHTPSGAFRPPLADLTRTTLLEPVMLSSADRRNVIHIKVDNGPFSSRSEPGDAGASALHTPNVHVGSATPQDTAPAEFTLQDQTEVLVTDSSTGSIKSSLSIGRSTTPTRIQHADSSSQGSAQSSILNDRSSGNSTDKTVVSTPQAVQTSRPLDLIPVSNRNSVAFDQLITQGDTNPGYAGSFLVPMIKPMTLQRSWTSVKNPGKRFIPLDDYDDEDL